MIFIMRHIEIVRSRPDHVRKQIALGVAVALTAVIALFWLALSIVTGAFAIDNETSFGDVAVQKATDAPQNRGSFVGAAAAALGGNSEPAHIEIVNTTVDSTLDTPREEPTIIPF